MEQVLTRLARNIQHLGHPTEQISPAIYDSAYALLRRPAYEHHPATLQWLASQQHDDGGWSDPHTPYARVVPTLAAVLALHHSQPHVYQSQIERGLAFLREAMPGEGTRPHDGIATASELLVPYLLAHATVQGLALPPPHPELVQLGQRRRQRLIEASHAPGTPPLYCWEAWGTAPEARHVDAIGSVGNSPAATVAWLAAAQHRPELRAEVARARRYLGAASAATGNTVPGLLPNVWPIERYERAFGLYMLDVAGLSYHPRLRRQITRQLDLLHQEVGPAGLGMSSEFIPDSDTTAAALTVLTRCSQRPVDLGALHTFRHRDHFATYHGEIQPSLTSTAHALHALQSSGAPCDPALYDFVLNRQEPDGLWRVDKWNVRWTYATSQVLLVLDPQRHAQPLHQALATICHKQHPAGGWGDGRARREETAYLVLALRHLLRRAPQQLGDTTLHALRRAERWLASTHNTPTGPQDASWMGKEIYHPSRLASLIELAATLPT
ncbi:MAG: hypothetical protein OHK0022_42870 [Roseiflexaceae bacterium]